MSREAQLRVYTACLVTSSSSSSSPSSPESHLKLVTCFCDSVCLARAGEHGYQAPAAGEEKGNMGWRGLTGLKLGRALSTVSIHKHLLPLSDLAKTPFFGEPES